MTASAQQPLCALPLESERDVVTVRQRIHEVAARLGFERQDRTRIATAVSEIARNAYGYGGGGSALFLIDPTPPRAALMIRISDRGPGIRDVARILDGRYESPTGMGLGIVGARRLMDRFELSSDVGRGTTVVLGKLLPRGVPIPTSTELSAIADTLALQHPPDPAAEVQRQNHELLRVLDDLKRREDDLTELNRELEDTNRGVVALYAELDEKADRLRRADVVKSRFLSNMSHEFRTPVNSILALSRMLLDRTDGDLTAEQNTQVTFIYKAAESLSELVNDLLDLAKVEAGKIAVNVSPFEISDLFGALRGMLRPLLMNDAVGLTFDEPEGLPALRTDEAKVAQILRNFLSNALKFTEQGEVRVSARLVDHATAIAFSVTDTGIGIAPEDQERIFDEFSQVDSPVQRRVRGTGLGLPLCRKLASLLGGRVEVESHIGAGSRFTLIVPITFRPLNDPRQQAAPAAVSAHGSAARTRILVIDDEAVARYILMQHLADPEHLLFEADDGLRGLEAARRESPDVICLDLLMPGADGAEILRALRNDPTTAHIPVIMVTSQPLDDMQRTGLLTLASAILPKGGLTKARVRDALEQVRTDAIQRGTRP